MSARASRASDGRGAAFGSEAVMRACCSRWQRGTEKSRKNPHGKMLSEARNVSTEFVLCGRDYAWAQSR